MKINITFILIISLSLITCQKTKEQSEPSAQLYPKDLKFGDYQVGYETLWVYDITRPSVPYSDWNGKLYQTKESRGRQFQINIWYPSNYKMSNQKMTIGDFMRLHFRQIDFEESQESIRFGKQELITKLKELGGSDSLSINDLAKLDDLTTKSTLNTNSLNEQFPLILYPNGLSPFTTSIGAEYLASHGFVVVGFALKGQNKSTEDISTRGADVAADDIKFVLSEVLKLPYVDGANVGIMANAIQSSFCVGYQVKNRTLKSIVSLEGGFLSNFEQELLNDLPFYEPQNLDIPILSIYSPHPSIDPTHIDHLKYAKRYFTHFPEMREYDYLNFGMFNNVIPNIIGVPRGDINPSYVKAHLIIKDFFTHTLKTVKPNYDAEFLSMKPTVSDSVFIWENIPNIPNLTVIKDNYIKKGFTYLDSIYHSHKKYTPQPFSREFIKDFRDWVSWKKDPDYLARLKFYEMAVASYPSSALINYYLAYYNLKTGDSTSARQHYQQTLTKLDADTDSALTPELKIQLEKIATQEIKKLKN